MTAHIATNRGRPEAPRLPAPFGWSVYLGVDADDPAELAATLTPVLEQALAAVDWPPGVKVNGIHANRDAQGRLRRVDQ